ncbi:MAG TPA: putative Fe-S cluster assembly protein SufT [Spongiibacteraceae bacterium]|nr:putative Fe-S cluster assembly protein SufT [Spongiibacteraceae bacterium]
MRDLTADAGKASPLIPTSKPNSPRERVTLARAVNALRVPSGESAQLPANAAVAITQALGGSFSVEHEGRLYRIDGLDADALGKPRLELQFNDAEPGIIKLEHVDKVLRTVYDPEIPVNILDLGLVYARRVEGKTISIDMTLTAPACGMGDVLRAEIARRLQQVPNVEHVEVNLVFTPQWNRSMLSEVAKLELGMF